MSSAQKNLSDVHTLDATHIDGVKIGVVRSAWNEQITSKLMEGALHFIQKAGIEQDRIYHLDVPGSYELPMGAKILIAQQQVDAVICLGCVIKGETDHDKYINQAVANGLMQLSLLSGVPCIFGLLTVNDEQQALDRSGGAHGNKGVEAAATALHMIALKKQKAKKIGF